MDNKNLRAMELLQRNLPIFNALGNPVRQRIMLLLSDDVSKNVAQLTKQTGLARPTVSHHIKILKKAGLLTVHRKGVNYYYTPQYSTPLKSLREFISFIEKIEKTGGTIAKITKTDR